MPKTKRRKAARKTGTRVKGFSYKRGRKTIHVRGYTRKRR